MKNRQRKYFLGAAMLFALGLVSAAVESRREPLDQQFRTPPPDEKPWVYYWWVKGNVDQPTITRDLEQMKAKGIGGFLLFDARGYGEDHLPPPPAPMEFLSPEWRSLVKFTMSEANRLGLRMSMNLSTYGGSLRAPWTTGAFAPKKLIWTSAAITGPQKFVADLEKPSQSHFWDVALLAIRVASADASNTGAGALSQNWRDIVFDRKTAGPLAEEVVDLSEHARSGRLTWDVPAGHWTILRFAGVTMEGHESDVDILNTNAVDDHFERMGKTFLADAGPLAGKTLTYFYNVSWEGASPTWTVGFDQDFMKYRGYSFRSYLPVLAGMTVGNNEKTARFLEDYSRTIGDCFLNNCYRRLGDLCHKAGLQWHSESGGPWDRTRPLFVDSDQIAFWGANDMPQGEFWHDRWETRPDGSKVWLSNMRRTAMAAHIYGRPLAAAESFTNMNPHWQEYPAVLKPDIDSAFIDGTNQVVWHTFDASPAKFGKPGIDYFAGTHLNPNVTWFDQAGPFLAYLGRGQVMLRQGHFVADLCVYTSDRNYIRWGREKTWGDKPSLEPPPGYTYDLINTEVLLNRLSVRNGNIVLPDGMQYRMLVLDLDDPIMPEPALAKVAELAKAGATIVLGSRRPEREPGLESAEVRDAQIHQIAAELWGSAGQATKSLGQGRVVRGASVSAALEQAGILPDFSGPFEYLHRHADGLDIYFVKGSGKSECTFRVNGKQPELWDAVNGSIQDAPTWRTAKDGRTVVPLDLPANGSIFVVFRRTAAAPSTMSGGPKEIIWSDAALALDTDWRVSFPAGFGAPASASFARLTPWNENQENGIRYFSGTATYYKTFALDSVQAKARVRLDLGDVKDIARVRLNGKSLGIVWTAPWTVDLTGIAKPGANELEIDVTNTWVIRLVGDAALPAGQQITKTIARRSPEYHGRYPYLRGYLATDPLLPSGLMGPVRIEFGKR